MKMHLQSNRLYVTSPGTSYSHRGWLSLNNRIVPVTAHHTIEYGLGNNLMIGSSITLSELEKALKINVSSNPSTWPLLLLALLNNADYRVPIMTWLADVRTLRPWEKNP